jgi:hypothetical protein
MGDSMKITAENQRFVAPTNWEAQIFAQNPIFAGLASLFPLAQCHEFPSLSLLNQWVRDYQPSLAVSFVDNEELTNDGRYYEEFIFATGKVPTRSENWHDLFGALIWCLFPKSKMALNRRHQQEIALHGKAQRSPVRHRLTLLDECGVLLCYTEDAAPIIEQLKNHQWQQAMFSQRASWRLTHSESSTAAGGHELEPMIFGHAIYEMATRPYLGLTAKLWPMLVPQDFCGWPLLQRIAFIDEQLSVQISNNSLAEFQQQLTPLPLLGVPGWYAENCQQAFYLNTEYFRPKRDIRESK